MIYPTNIKARLNYNIESEAINYSVLIKECSSCFGVHTSNIINHSFQLRKTGYNQRGFFFELEKISTNIELSKELRKQEYLVNKLKEVTTKVQFIINQTGSIVQLVNYNDLLKKWEKIKKEILLNEENSIILDYVNGVEQKISNDKLLLSDFKEYKFYGLLFGGLHGKTYSPHKITVINRVFEGLIHFINIQFKERISLVGIKENNLQLELNGILDINEETKGRLRNYFWHKGIPRLNELKIDRYYGKLNFDLTSGLLKSANISIILSYGQAYKKSMNYIIDEIPKLN